MKQINVNVSRFSSRAIIAGSRSGFTRSFCQVARFWYRSSQSCKAVCISPDNKQGSPKAAAISFACIIASPPSDGFQRSCHGGTHKVPHIVHGMVIFFDGAVFCSRFIPAIKQKFPNNVCAVIADVQVLHLQQAGRVPNAVQYAVICLPDPKQPMPPNAFNEGCSGRVNDDCPNFSGNISSKLLQRFVMFFIGSGCFGLASVIIIFSQADCVPVWLQVPQPCTGWVQRAVVAGNVIITARL